MRGAYAILSPISKSHPFEERKVKVGPEDDPLKIGRSVARLKPTVDNGIFDCKVLSRNHAIMWYQGGEFFLRDTKSSNGTFVNNDRLAVTGTESEAKHIFTGDIMQFGVEIIENTNKVAHGCIYAMIQLFDEDGNEVVCKNTVDVNQSCSNINLAPSLVNSHQLFQIQQYLSEAMYRADAQKKRIRELEDILESIELNTDTTRNAVVSEDRLLSRIETLENLLAACAKTVVGDKLREDLTAAIEDKAKFETITKENLRRAQEEKAEADLRRKDIDRSLVNTEEECSRLTTKVLIVEAKLNETVEAFDDKQRELSAISSLFTDLEKKLALSEENVEAESRRADGAIVDRECDRMMPNLIGILMDAIRAGDHVSHEEPLIALAELLREKDLGVPAPAEPESECVQDPISPTKLPNGDNILEKSMHDIKDFAVPCPKCIEQADNEERDAIVREDVEKYLKENLQLNARVRDLETALSEEQERARAPPMNLQLEMAALQSVNSSPRERSNRNNVAVKSGILYRDNFIPSLLVFSLTPFLAVLLLVLLPAHRRFFGAGM